MTEEPELFLLDLSHEFPVLKYIVQEHLNDNKGVLPHLLMADYCRTVLNAKEGEPWVSRFLNKLEKRFSLEAEDKISNVIAVSFVEHLPPPNEANWIVQQLGRNMKHQYVKIFGKVGH